MAGEIGCLGDIIFTVSDKQVRTFSGLQYSGSARIAEHYRHGAAPLAEMTGLDSDKITINMTLTSEMGVNVGNELASIQRHMERGTQLPLVIGRRMYGKYRWQITAYSIKEQRYDAACNVSLATVTINLLEYLRN